MVLDKINKANDVKNLTNDEILELPAEIRSFLIEHISKTGGHLASNLGTVELTIALHLVCNFPEDKLIWDVGHQSYTHKILTGRKNEFDNLRKYGGMSGFPKRAESDCDSFDTGHSSTSISAALGYAYARDLSQEDHKVICVIGDGSLTGGMAYEALNNASLLKSNLLIVINDNEMSISKNVGGVPLHLSRFRTSRGYMGLKEDVLSSLERKNKDRTISKIRTIKSSIKQLFVPGMMFEDMGILYLGPVDGHDIDAMVSHFNMAFTHKGPVIVHVRTQKGLGYEPAVNHPSRFHGTGPFDIDSGLLLNNSKPSYTDIFSTVMRKFGDRNPRVCAITAAMADGTGLKRFSNMFPDRFYDVGIAEEHAVTFAAALSLGGMIPIFAVYSSFLQRAYDQIMSDVCLQHLHVVFAIDRAGVVGSDGETHHGIFDIAYLSTMPGMTIMAPKNKYELSDMIKFAVDYDGPIAVRYPRGEAYCGLKNQRDKIVLGKSEMIVKGSSRVLLFALGTMVKISEEAIALLDKEGLSVTLVNARFAKPLDKEFLKAACDDYDFIFTLEEGIISGGMGENVLRLMNQFDYRGRIFNIGIEDKFVSHGSVERLYQDLFLDAVSIKDRVMAEIKYKAE